MGAANCKVVNQTPLDILPVVTFNNADVWKNQSQNVEAAADAWGLKVCVGYNSSGNSLQCKLFFCNNGNTLKVTSTSQNGNVQATGCERKGDVTIDMNADNAAGFMSGINWTTDVVQDIVVPIVQESGSGSGQALTLTAAPDRGEWETCTDSTQCKNQCCSSKYSDGVLKCTPVGGFKPSEGCVGSSTSTSTTSTSKLGEWQQCSNSKQCNNQCCSSKYSDGVLKCTPVGGFKPSEGCVGSATR
eukprot:scaffold40534_cov548-Skeletonema_marinoi.AAC.1